MSEMQHTPGPHHFEPGDPGDASVGIGPSPPYVWAEGPDGEPIVLATLSPPRYRVEPEPGNEYDEGLRDHGTEDGNGRLYAAATGLLEMCRRMARLIEFVPDITGMVRPGRIKAEAEALIAQVDGGGR